MSGGEPFEEATEVRSVLLGNTWLNNVVRQRNEIVLRQDEERRRRREEDKLRTRDFIQKELVKSGNCSWQLNLDDDIHDEILKELNALPKDVVSVVSFPVMHNERVISVQIKLL